VNIAGRGDFVVAEANLSLSMQHRPPQPYQTATSGHQIQQQSRTLTGSSQPAAAPSYSASNLFSPQPGLQSPFLTDPSQFQAQHGPVTAPNYYRLNPSPQSQHSASTAYYPPGESHRDQRRRRRA